MQEQPPAHIGRFKEVAGIFKAGISGALAFTGICLLLIIFVNVFSRTMPRITFVLVKLLQDWPLGTLCLITACIGFILGALVIRRFFPRVQKGMAPMAIAAIPLILGAWAFNAVAIRVSVPQSMKVGDCTNSVLDAHITIPQGHGYLLVLNASDLQSPTNDFASSSYKFAGSISIFDGASLLTNFPIGSDKAWLSGSKFFLTGAGAQNTNAPSLSQIVQAGKDYNVRIIMSPQPPPSSSIWLHWRQAARDMKENEK